MTKQTMLLRDMDRDNLCNEMRLRSQANYVHIFCDPGFKSKACPYCRSKIRREEF